jgi:hypothetical protein
LPTRIDVSSSSRTTIASTFLRGMPRSAMSSSTRWRMPGSASPNAAMRSYFV